VKAYEAIVKGENIAEPSIPESFKVLLKEMQSLALDVNVVSEEGQRAEMADEDDDLLRAAEELGIDLSASLRAREGAEDGELPAVPGLSSFLGRPAPEGVDEAEAEGGDGDGAGTEDAAGLLLGDGDEAGEAGEADEADDDIDLDAQSGEDEGEFGDIDIKALGIDLDEDAEGDPEEIEHRDD
jgi:DNA-directed RNA polymerase subunit beta